MQRLKLTFNNARKEGKRGAEISFGTEDFKAWCQEIKTKLTQEFDVAAHSIAFKRVDDKVELTFSTSRNSSFKPKDFKEALSDVTFKSQAYVTESQKLANFFGPQIREAQYI